MNKKQKQFDCIRPGTSPGIKVPGTSYHDLLYALRTFKQMVKDSDKLEELRERRYFQKPSAKRRKKLNDAIYFEKQARKDLD